MDNFIKALTISVLMSGSFMTDAMDDFDISPEEEARILRQLAERRQRPVVQGQGQRQGHGRGPGPRLPPLAQPLPLPAQQLQLQPQLHPQPQPLANVVIHNGNQDRNRLPENFEEQEDPEFLEAIRRSLQPQIPPDRKDEDQEIEDEDLENAIIESLKGLGIREIDYDEIDHNDFMRDNGLPKPKREIAPYYNNLDDLDDELAQAIAFSLINQENYNEKEKKEKVEKKERREKAQNQIKLDQIHPETKWDITQTIDKEIKRIYDLFPQYNQYVEELDGMEKIKDQYDEGGELAQRNYQQGIRFLTIRRDEVFKDLIEPVLKQINYQQIAMNAVPGLTQPQATKLLEEIGYDF